MSNRQWLLITTIGLTIFNLLVIPWGIDLFVNGSDNARIYIMMSSVITVPVLLATVCMNIICFLSLIVPEHIQESSAQYFSHDKSKKLWSIVKKVIDIID